ncbi:MAG: zf-HC2 domain-containing protein, partial [Planctomycetes bacterium]|nr:zf-HC2 domain-containing protein [Planctomycetota bacterium]
MDKHKHYQEEIVAYLMGELPAVGRQALCDHLRSCGSCKKLLEDYRVTLDLAGAIPDPEPPPGFTGRVLASARAARASHEQFLHEQALQEAHAADTSTFERTTPSWRRSLAYRTARIVAYASIAIIVFIA